MPGKAKNSPIDMFDLFWNALLHQSKECSLSILNEKHIPLEESREICFEKLENRLAYLYRFGNFNIHLSEKCIGSFLEQYLEANKLFSKKDLKICSLTNGPGLDLIGLFKSIVKCNIRFINVPDLKIISMYDTWWNISQSLLTHYYEVICSCFEDNINKPSIKFDGIVNDIYSELSSESKASIEESDVLLMFKVFYSSKATLEKAVNSMKEIFSLLKPGSIVFFLGSKTNTKELAENAELQNFVDCILGPIKISSDLQDEDVIKQTALQPRKSGYGYFVVWKKKGVSLKQIKSKKKKSKKSSKKKNKSKNKGAATENDDTFDSIDTQSEVSFISCSEQSETFEDSPKSASCENLPTSGVKSKSKEGLMRKVLKQLMNNSLQSLSNNSDTDYKTSTSHNHFDESPTVSHAKLFRSHSVTEMSKKKLEKKHLNLSLSDLHHSVKNLTSQFNKMQIQPVKARSKSVCSLDKNHQVRKEPKHLVEKKDFSPAKFQDDLLMNVDSNKKLKVENVADKKILDESKTTKKSKSLCIVNENSLVLSESALENKMKSNLAHSEECLYIEGNKSDQSNEGKQDFNTLLQSKLKVPNISSEIPKDKSKKSKSSMKNKKPSVMNGNSSMLSGLGVENEIDENTHNCRIAVENKMQSNLIQSEGSMCTEDKASNTCDKMVQDINSLLQRCGNLITTLEKFTEGVEQNVTSRNDNFRCSCCEPCDKLKPLPVSTTSCSVHSNFRKRNCHCHVCLNCCCTRSNTCEASACECNRGMVPVGVSNISTPYIVIPVMKEDILHILTSKNS